jgi:hypothetical protein
LGLLEIGLFLSEIRKLLKKMAIDPDEKFIPAMPTKLRSHFDWLAQKTPTSLSRPVEAEGVF